MKFAERLKAQGAPVEVTAVAPESTRSPVEAEMCLARLLVMDAGDGHGSTVRGVIHGELAPLVVGGIESARVLLAVRELLRDFVAQPGAELERELRQALQHIDGLANGIDTAVQQARAEHVAHHQAEATKRAVGETLQ